MPHPKVEQRVRLYNAGVMTHSELVLWLINVAMTNSPSELAEGLPTTVLQDLRGRAANPPSSVDDCPLSFAMGGYIGRYDHEAEMRERQRLWYEGIWKWHVYFQELDSLSNSESR